MPIVKSKTKNNRRLHPIPARCSMQNVCERPRQTNPPTSINADTQNWHHYYPFTPTTMCARVCMSAILSAQRVTYPETLASFVSIWLKNWTLAKRILCRFTPALQNMHVRTHTHTTLLPTRTLITCCPPRSRMRPDALNTATQIPKPTIKLHIKCKRNNWIAQIDGTNQQKKIVNKKRTTMMHLLITDGWAHIDHDQGKVSTLAMVIMLVVIVKCVFLCFALMAVCYR